MASDLHINGHFLLQKPELRYPWECQICGYRRLRQEDFDEQCPGYNPNASVTFDEMHQASHQRLERSRHG